MSQLPLALSVVLNTLMKTVLSLFALSVPMNGQLQRPPQKKRAK